MNHEPAPLTSVDESKITLTGRKALRPNHHLWDQRLRRWVLNPIRAPYEAGLKLYYGEPHYHGPGTEYWSTEVVLAPNHRNWNDIPYTHMFGRDILGANFTIFPMKEELIRSFPYASFILPSLGGIFIDRDNPDVKGLLEQNHRLARKYDAPTCIYPEGTRVRTTKERFKDANPKEIQGVKTGAIRFSMMSGYPIMPLGIAGLAEYDRPDPSKGVHLFAGAPLYTPRIDIMKDSAETRDIISQEAARLSVAMQACFDSAQELRAGYTPPNDYPGPKRRNS